MGSYVHRVLSNGERVEYQAKVSVWSLLPLIGLGFLTLLVGGLGLIFFLAAYLKYISTEMAVTNKRVIAKTGFISRRTVELKLERVETVQIDQGILGRMLNFGSVVVAGAGTPQAPIPGIDSPIDFRNAVMSVQEANEKTAA